MNQGSYQEMIGSNGAIAGDGLQALSHVASMGGNLIDLGQGHKELTESYRTPLHTGHSQVRDDIRGAMYIGGQFAVNPMKPQG